MASHHNADHVLTAHANGSLALHSSSDLKHLCTIPDAHSGNRIDDVCLDLASKTAFSTADGGKFVRVWQVLDGNDDGIESECH